jgi:hypothetical protein
MKRMAIALCMCLLLLGCKEKDNQSIASPPAIDSGIEPSGNELVQAAGNIEDSSNVFATDEVDEEEDIIVGDYRIARNGTLIWYRGDGGEIVIPAEIGGILVTAIRNIVFYEYSLTSVAIPDTVTYIGSHAFFDNRLTNLTIPDSVTTIGHSAFGRNLLTSLIIPDSVTTIEPAVFQSNLLTSVTLPSGLTTISGALFIFNSLSSFTIPNSVTSIGNDAFAYNQLTSITIPDSVASIGKGTFDFNRERTVTSDNKVLYGENLLNTVIIGANVLLGEEDVPSFDNGFDDFYNSNGKQAGTYICSDGQWSMAAR